MKKLRISLDKLFEFLGKSTLDTDVTSPISRQIFVETPGKELVPILGVTIKQDDRLCITTETGKTVICGSKHKFMSTDGFEISAADATSIYTVDGVETIISKDTLPADVLYDISIPYPHWYITPNGIVHHNSNFIKYIVSRSKQNALITYDPEIMKKDGIFAAFIEGDYGSLIMEDADAFLGARSDGNQMMAKFLNVGDGIVSMANKKLIFSTNLEKLDDIDPALLRPGRCFAVVQFRKMTFDESKQFLVDHKITGWAPTPGEEYSLAELYNHTKQVRKVTTKRKLGFY